MLWGLLCEGAPLILNLTTMTMSGLIIIATISIVMCYYYLRLLLLVSKLATTRKLQTSNGAPLAPSRVNSNIGYTTNLIKNLLGLCFRASFSPPLCRMRVRL